MTKGKKRAVGAPTHTDSSKDKRPGAEQDYFSLVAQALPADALKPKPKHGESLKVIALD